MRCTRGTDFPEEALHATSRHPEAVPLMGGCKCLRPCVSTPVAPCTTTMVTITASARPAQAGLFAGLNVFWYGWKVISSNSRQPLLKLQPVKPTSTLLAVCPKLWVPWIALTFCWGVQGRSISFDIITII